MLTLRNLLSWLAIESRCSVQMFSSFSFPYLFIFCSSHKFRPSWKTASFSVSWLLSARPVLGSPSDYILIILWVPSDHPGEVTSQMCQDMLWSHPTPCSRGDLRGNTCHLYSKNQSVRGGLGPSLLRPAPARKETSLRFNFWEAGLVESSLAQCRFCCIQG